MIQRKLMIIVNGSLLFVFLLSLITGIIKFPGLLDFLNIEYSSLPNYQINLIHDWGGLALVVLIFIHLILNRRWVFSQLSFGERIKKRHLVIILLIVALLFLSYFIQNIINPENRISQLESVQIREYEGEDLSSISDVQETGIKGIQRININDYLLEVSGLVENNKEYTYDQVLEFPHYSKVVELECVVGWKAKILWEGILLKDLLNDSEINPEAKIVIFYAEDGFATSLPLDFVMNNDILLAYKMNGVVLPEEKGFPFQLVAEKKYGYKWIKWVTKIELSDDVDYRGTYESRGYSNDANVDGPKREN